MGSTVSSHHSRHNLYLPPAFTYCLLTTGRCTLGCVEEEGLPGQGGGQAGLPDPLHRNYGGLAEALLTGQVTRLQMTFLLIFRPRLVKQVQTPHPHQ